MVLNRTAGTNHTRLQASLSVEQTAPLPNPRDKRNMQNTTCNKSDGILCLNQLTICLFCQAWSGSLTKAALLQLPMFPPTQATQTIITGQTQYKLSAPPSYGLAHVLCSSSGHLNHSLTLHRSTTGMGLAHFCRARSCNTQQAQHGMVCYHCTHIMHTFFTGCCLQSRMPVLAARHLNCLQQSEQMVAYTGAA